MWREREYVDPFDYNDPNFWIKIEHLGRYLFTLDYMKKINFGIDAMDAGCGNGYGTNVLSKSVDSIMGFDIDLEAITYAKDKHNNIQFKQFDFSNSLSNEIGYSKFNFVVAFEFLEHLFNPENTIKDFYNLLKPNGIFICSVPNPKFESIDENGKPKNKFHKLLISYEKLTIMLKNNGFQIKEELGQSLTNMMIKKEIKFNKKKKLPFSSSENDYFKENDFIKYFSYLLAYPEELNQDKSYSFIIISEKKNGSAN
jgi:2-polyprenyl-3-methyl-5-hydroxy-6-metoxy-1,4-benzoquinol methylase